MSRREAVNYIQLPLQEFVRLFPEYVRMISPMFDLSDSRYIVRIDPDGQMEIGYAEDHWVIK